MQRKTAVLIFAKLPHINYVKTRLISNQITAEDAFTLYSAFLKDTIFQAYTSKIDIVLLSLTDTTPITHDSIFDIEVFQSLKEKYSSKISINFHIQPLGTFGQRMKDAIEWAWKNNIGKLVVLGADSPQIQPSIINYTLNLLEDSQIVLGPSPEGGIYLIGLNDINSLIGFERVFDGVELISFSKFARIHQYRTYFLNELTDIDTESDLISLIAWIESVSMTSDSKHIPKYTAKAIENLGISIQIDETNNRQKKIIKINKERV